MKNKWKKLAPYILAGIVAIGLTSDKSFKTPINLEQHTNTIETIITENTPKQLNLEERVQQIPKLPDEFYQKGIVEASQREGVVASKENTRFIGTSGVYDCVGIIGYSEETGLGFVAHYDSLTDKDFKEMLNNPYYDPLPVSLGSLPYFLEEGDKSNREVTYEVRIFTTPRGDKELLEKIVSYINYMNEWSDKVKFEIEKVDTNSNGTLFLDLKTGKYFSYIPEGTKTSISYKNPDEYDISRYMFPGELDWKVLYALK